MTDLKKIELFAQLGLDVSLQQLDESQNRVVVAFGALDDELLQRSQFRALL